MKEGLIAFVIVAALAVIALFILEDERKKNEQ